MEETPVYTLHYFPFSLYSLMARFGFTLGSVLDPGTAPTVVVKLVNLHREENLSEDYLNNVNSKGEVPSLTSPALPSPLTDSRDISNWLCKQQPELIPPDHAQTIERLMDEIYAFHAMSLIIPSEFRKDGIPNQAAALLEKADLTQGHRRALEIRSLFHDTTYSRTLEADSIAESEEKAAEFFTDLDKVLVEYHQGGTWIFGDRPSILDAHATALLVRLLDCKMEHLMSDNVKEYARGVVATPEWARVTHGRPTLWDVSMGHVANLTPL